MGSKAAGERSVAVQDVQLCTSTREGKKARTFSDDGRGRFFAHSMLLNFPQKMRSG